MRLSDRTESFPARSGLVARMAGCGVSNGSGPRHACACGSLRSGGCERKRFPGHLSGALEALGVDRIVFETLDSLDPHGIRR
ncbi:MAG: ATP-binding protein [Hoeflea sp.]|nr:ATP-binding protein [Hoeflea sp.]